MHSLFVCCPAVKLKTFSIFFVIIFICIFTNSYFLSYNFKWHVSKHQKIPQFVCKLEFEKFLTFRYLHLNTLVLSVFTVFCVAFSFFFFYRSHSIWLSPFAISVYFHLPCWFPRYKYSDFPRVPMYVCVSICICMQVYMHVCLLVVVGIV